MVKPFHSPGGKRAPDSPRRTWHGADREPALPIPRSGRSGCFGIGLLAFVGIVLGCLIGWLLLMRFDLPQPARKRSLLADVQNTPAPQATILFSLCHTGGGINCVVDGDTIWMQGEKIRIADIDTPETHLSRCAAEAELGDRATKRLLALLNAGPVTLQHIERDEDRFGRKLRRVMRDGSSLGNILVNEGLARHYQGGPRAGWCGSD